jgi:hypothetical protein
MVRSSTNAPSIGARKSAGAYRPDRGSAPLDQPIDMMHRTGARGHVQSPAESPIGMLQNGNAWSASTVKRMAQVLLTCPLVVALSTAGDARAIGPVRVELAGKIGLGTNPTTTGPSPLGLGLGGRAGASLAGFYLGAAAMYYKGGTASAGSEIETIHSVMYGAEGGYGAEWLGHLTIRGVVGVGSFEQRGSGVATGGRSNLYLEPGVTSFWSLGPLFAGADVNVFLLPSAVPSTYAALTLHAQIGLAF